MSNALNAYKDIISEYADGVPIYKIVKKYKTSHESVTKRSISKNSQKYIINENYFKTWSSNMAYILGFIGADGCVINGQLIITLQMRDVEILNFIKKELNCGHPIIYGYTILNNKKYDTVKLRIRNKEICNDLSKLNIIPRKTFVLAMPENIPEEYKIDYIRGNFDGDGSVDENYPTNARGCKTKSPQIRTRFCGSEKIMTEIRDILTIKGLRNVNIHKKYKIYTIEYSTFDSIKFYDLMYYSQNILYLKRKRDKFLNIINKRKDKQLEK